MRLADNMLTFIVNLHNSLNGLHLSTPLFYELKATGSFFQFSGKLSEMGNLFERVRLELQNSNDTTAQFVFLLDLPETTEDSSIFKSSLAYRLAQIRRFILDKVEVLGYKTAFNYAIILDTVTRLSYEGKPSSKLSRQVWEFDVCGTIAEPDRYGFLFSEDDFKRIDDTWGGHLVAEGIRTDIIIEELGVPLSPEDKENKVRCTDRDCDSKVQEIANEIKARISSVCHDVNALSEGKKKAAAAFLKDHDELSVLFSADIFDNLKDDFCSELKKIQRRSVLGHLLKMQPSELLRELIRKHMGAERFTNEIKVLHFPFPDIPHPVNRENLVRLAYLVLLLSTGREQDLSVFLRHHQFYSVKIELEIAAITSMYSQYIIQLEIAAERLRNEIKDSLSGHIDVYDDASCVCNAVLNNVELSKPVRFNLLGGPDAQKWGAWLKHMGEKLENIRGDAHEKLEKCAEEMRVKGRDSKPKEFQDIEMAVVHFRKQYDDLQKSVMKDQKTDYQFNWIKETLQEDAQIRELAARRPSAGQVGYTFVVGLLCFYAAYGSGATLKFDQDKMGFLIIPVAILVFCTLMIWGMLIFHRRKLSRIVSEVCKMAKSNKDKLRTFFNTSKALVQNLSRLDIYRRNYENAVRVCEEVTIKRLLLRYHSDQLTKHVAMAKALLSDIKSSCQDSDTADLDVIIRPELPVFDNEVYFPFTYTSNNAKTEVFSGETQMDFSSALLTGLKIAEFKPASVENLGGKGLLRRPCEIR
jgi:hypothetical protein